MYRSLYRCFPIVKERNHDVFTSYFTSIRAYNCKYYSKQEETGESLQPEGPFDSMPLGESEGERIRWLVAIGMHLMYIIETLCRTHPSTCM